MVPDPRITEHARHVIAVPPSDPMLFPLLATIPLQLLSYHMSVELGYDPDFPRNLSKTLTVD